MLAHTAQRFSSMRVKAISQQLGDTLKAAEMTFLFKIEEIFEISGRGSVIVPAIDVDPSGK